MPDLPLYVIAYRLAGSTDLASLHTNGTVETHGFAVTTYDLGGRPHAGGVNHDIDLAKGLYSRAQASVDGFLVRYIGNGIGTVLGAQLCPDRKLRR
jgi:hypothetical protein